MHSSGQTKGGFTPGIGAESLLDQSLQASIATGDAAKGIYPADNVVAADYYYVGPGDVLLMQRVDALSLGPGEPLIVSPENTVVLPRFGEINLRNKTLAQVRQEIQDSAARRLPGSRVFITLQRPRTVYVTIKGNVAKPGLYAFPASMSVSTAVSIANGNLIAESQKNMQPMSSLPSQRDVESIAMSSSVKGQYIGSYSERNMLVLHKNGTSVVADAIRSQVMGDPAANQMLREGDEIYVPYADESYSLVSISGAVYRPAIIPYRPGDKASFLLKLSYGLTEKADSTRVYIVTETGERIPVSISGAMDGSNDPELTAGSSMIVEEKSQRGNERITVAVTGHIQRPGTYEITPGTTRLRNVIEQAGGFTSDAYLPLAYILRRGMVSYQEKGDMDFYRNLQTSSLSLLDTTRYRLDLQMRRPVVSVDFEAAFNRKSEIDNVLLQNGDVIVVPDSPKNVYVFGQVAKPGYVAYEPGKTMEWYIEHVGGYAVDADEDRARIIKARTRLWVEGDDEVIVEAGDEIYVPRPTELPPGIAEQRYSTIASFGGILIGLASLVANILIFSR
jgi:protein involved in polysaccharide export with SLBB domain